LRSARERGRTTVCANNLRQHYLAFMSYTDDFNDYLVPWIAPIASDCSSLMIWQTLLLQKGYLPTNPLGSPSYLTLRLGLTCPSNHNGYYANPGVGFNWYDGTPNYLYVSEAGTPCPGITALRKLFAVVSPSVKAMLYEGGLIAGWGTPYRCNYVMQTGFVYPPFFTPGDGNYAIGDVHNNASNVLFFDGHVQGFAAGTIDPASSMLTMP
jgi:prepilin-type processing-associated H-X9-DG protein